MTQILVTGAFGFLGSWLCRELISGGHTVLGIDDFSSSSSEARDFEDSSRFSRFELDIVAPDASRAMIEKAQRYEISEIYHLACPASPVDYMNNPLKTLEVCSTGTRNVAQTALEAGARLLYASTSEVYGDPLISPQREDYFGNVNTLGPRSMYDEGKRFGEALLSSCAANLGLDLRIARIFNSYGPGMREDDGRLIPEAIKRIRGGLPVTVHGDGNQTRSMCYVSDTISGLISLMAAEVMGPVNIGNSDERTVLDIVTCIADQLAVEFDIEWQPPRVDDPLRRCPDTSRAEALLSWRPDVSLEQGLRSTLYGKI